MTHARNVWVAIALESVRRSTGWSHADVVRYIGADLARAAAHCVE